METQTNPTQLRDELLQVVGDCSSSKDTCRDIADAILAGELDEVLAKAGFVRQQ